MKCDYAKWTRNVLDFWIRKTLERITDEKESTQFREK